MRTILLAVIALGVSATVYAEPAVGLMIGQHNYCGHRYVPKPVAGSFVFFDDYPIYLRLWLATRTAGEGHRMRSLGGAQNAISAKATFFALPAGASSRGATVEVGLRVRGEVSRDDNGVETEVPWNDEFLLEPGVAYVIPVELATRLSPGFYRLQVHLAGTDERGDGIVPGTFDFELRSASQDSEPERIRRRACSALKDGLLEEAELEARKLLTLMPTSSEGYALLAEAAEKKSDDYRSRGDVARGRDFADEARRNYQKQLDMQSGDLLLLKHTPSTILEEDAKGIRRKAAAPR
jgi:hypothetical protein